MRINEIEISIADGEMTAAQVFTQMRQHVQHRSEIIDEAMTAIFSCEFVEPNVKHIRLYEAVGVLQQLKKID
jgi:hypothetical protein